MRTWRPNPEYIFQAFAERGKTLAEVFADAMRQLESEVELNESDDYILNVNEADYINYLHDAYVIDFPKLDFGNTTHDYYEKDVLVEAEIRRLYGRPNMTTKRSAYVFMTPYSGPSKLLSHQPSRHFLRSYETFLESGQLCFEIIDQHSDYKEVEREYDQVIEYLRESLKFCHQDIEQYNSGVRTRAEQAFRNRKERILKRRQQSAAMKVPLRKRDNDSGTYAIPTLTFRASINAKKPVVIEKGYEPEPTIDQSVYQAILQTIHDVGKQLERMPNLYSHMQEETIRDLLLSYLAPEYDSATGETFNKAGKTDILVRYKNSNLFVAECKYWKGAAGYLETIDQLLSYLTWRDSKAAIVLFVKNKELSSVLDIIKDTTPQHQNYLGFNDQKEDTWFNYRIHINGDKNREAKVAILAFHLPPISKLRVKRSISQPA